MNHTKIMLCACSSRAIIDKEKLTDLYAVLTSQGCEVKMVPDLCKVAQEQTEELAEVAKSVIVACYPRAVTSLLAWRGVECSSCVNLRNSSVNEVLGALGLSREEEIEVSAKEFAEEEVASLPSDEGSDAWFPVIDKSRCTNCGKCHDFCLFGVYEVAHKEVRVVNPAGCKNNCPACARVCPQRAIIFAKYEKSPINGGEAQEEEFDAETIDKMYNERLRYKLQERRERVSLLKRAVKD